MNDVTIRPADDLANDLEQRRLALELSQAFIVRAPAGSGKTDLLTRRLLKLLAVVNEPEEILAITFTRAATAEMRSRVLQHLEEAVRAPHAQLDEDERVTLARAALTNSEARGWRLLEQPQRLMIETIDSLCLRIAHGQPLLSRMGGRLNPIERAELLYAQAARRTLEQLGCADNPLNQALTHLLAMRDNNLQDCEKLIAGMLAQRDQWIRAFPLVEDVDWDDVRLELERPFRREVKRALEEVYRLLATEPSLANELVELANYAAGNSPEKFGLLSGMGSLPSPEKLAVEHWACIAELLLTQGGEWRSGLTKANGFPTGGARERQQKLRMQALLGRLQVIQGLRDVLGGLGKLPLLRYDEDQWETLRYLFMTLRRAVAELRVIFAEENVVDFAELGIAARLALGSTDANPDLLLALSGGLRHLLVDEFQDTSRSQFDLIRLLMRVWEENDGRTCFLVGDPMQSIYMFRQAEVELFEHVQLHGIGGDESTIACELVRLSTNFRSHAGLTDAWNVIFEAVFGSRAPVPFSRSYAFEDALPGEALRIYPQVIGAADRKVTPEEKDEAQTREARQVLKIVEQHLPAIARAQAEGGEYRVAILVRARQHLAKIVRLLRERGIPFRAVELETLAERQELLDLLSLTRALLHPMDRVAWLSVLRAPWCGLTLRDLHTLTGADNRELRNRPMLELIDTHLHLLEGDSAERATRTVGVLKQALATRFQGLHAASFSLWIERTWRSLGGPLCVDAAAYENAQTYFSMLDSVAPDGMTCMTEDFETELEQLYAQPDPTVSERAGVQLMTIHKAKGLGFDVVIVPRLDRKAASDQPSLISSVERTNPATGDDEILVAPIGPKGDEKHPTYRWVQRQRTARQDEEVKRLLYVACTRARKELHLLGTATMNASGLKGGDAKSLLDVGWPAFQAKFEEAVKDKAATPGVVDFPLADVEQATLFDLFDLAAGAESRTELTLKRLTSSVDLRPRLKNVTTESTYSAKARDESDFVRLEGTRRARVLGSAVHALLDQLSRGAELFQLQQHARSILRTAAFAGNALDEAIHEVMAAVENCVKDPVGSWILESHPGAQSEASWTSWAGTGWEDETPQTLRADRVFRAGATPLEAGSDCLWIIDYKMSAPAGEAVEAFLATQRGYYAPQLARYAEALKVLEGEGTPLRLGLYYPRLARFDWWSGL
ncbi:MAG TPA: UvrD-helicase domain-containing protein [Silvibacterium sp.]|nr:UvrD-helicase domain-containing protein [Silvibacterium sp.]